MWMCLQQQIVGCVHDANVLPFHGVHESLLRPTALMSSCSWRVLSLSSTVTGCEDSASEYAADVAKEVLAEVPAAQYQFHAATA